MIVWLKKVGEFDPCGMPVHRPDKLRVQRRPVRGHKTPAFRPGVGRLLVARSGRRAPLGLSMEKGGWIRSDRRCCYAQASFKRPQQRQTAVTVPLTIYRCPRANWT